MDEQGWDTRVTADGGLSASIPDEQLEQYQHDLDECAARFGYDEPPPPLTRQEAEAYYDELVQATECVRELGYPTPEPASKQATVEALMRGEGPPWLPHERLLDTDDGDALDHAARECELAE